MKATVYYAPGDVRVETVPDPIIQQPTDAIVRIPHACICGSDLSGSIGVRMRGNRVGERDTNGWELLKRLALLFAL